MKVADVVALLIANTHKTKNMRTFNGKWITGAARIPDCISTRVGRIISLLQEKIDEGFLCNKDTEGLLIYNFQPIVFSQDKSFYTIEMLIRPLSEINEVHLKTGIPIQIFIDGSTHEVCNATKGMLDLGIIEEEELEEEEEKPIVYGNYMDYKSLAGFYAISSNEEISPHALFAGKLNNILIESPIFESFVESKHYLKDTGKKYQYIVEFFCFKDKEKTNSKGLECNVIKMIDVKNEDISITPHPEIASKEARLDVEVQKIQESLIESETETITTQVKTENQE